MRLTDDNVADYARTLALQTHAGGVVLDFSLESIPVLETLFQTSDPLLSLPQMPDRQRGLLIFYAGCYLGETIRTNLNGTWVFADDWVESRVDIPAGARRVEVRPFQKIERRIEGGSSHDLKSYVDALTELVAQESTAP